MAAGAARNNVLQRMKLNNKVALITGEALPPSDCWPATPHKGGVPGKEALPHI